MRNSLLMKKNLVFLLVFPLVLLLSCGGKRTSRSTTPEYKFTINGVVVKDLSVGKDIAYFTVLRDSVAFDSALVRVGTDTLQSRGGGVYSEEASYLFGFEDALTVTVSSAEDDFAFSQNFRMPAYFYIDEMPASDTLNTGGHEVSVSWRPSVHASGYFLSVVRPDTTPGVVGYTTLDELNDRSETIPLEGFRTSQGTLVYGTYEVCVIAYYGSFVEYPGKQFELPDGLPMDNLEGAFGTIGAGVVAERKHIKVVTQL
jgi:hypothetical protein